MMFRKYALGASVAFALFLLVGVFAVWQRANQDPFAGDQITNPAFPSLTYSIQVFGWWDDGRFGYQMDSVVMLGFNTIKHTFAWRDMEPQKGVWAYTEADRILDEAEKRNLHVIARLGQVPDWAIASDIISNDDTDAPPNDLADWANYCGVVATRYKGRITGYQIWNEPNLSREWGNQAPDAVGYTALLKACSEAIRAIDPDAKIISAGLAPTGTQDDTAHRDDVYLDALYRAGFQQYIDAVGVHAPGFSAPSYGPDDAERDGRGRWASFRRVEDLRKIMVAYGDASRQMAILEIGYTTDPLHPEYSWFAVTEAQRKDYMLEAYAYMAEHWRPWVGLVSAIYMQKPGWTQDNEEYWWSLSTFDRFHSPAFMAMMGMPKYCDNLVIEAGKAGASEEEYIGNVRACP
jgi:polysaccharide biosynthesis protein PslG